MSRVPEGEKTERRYKTIATKNFPGLRKSKNPQK